MILRNVLLFEQITFSHFSKDKKCCHYGTTLIVAERKRNLEIKYLSLELS